MLSRTHALDKEVVNSMTLTSLVSKAANGFGLEAESASGAKRAVLLPPPSVDDAAATRKADDVVPHPAELPDERELLTVE